MQGNFKVEISIKGTFHRSFFDKCEISHVCKSNTTALIEEQNLKKLICLNMKSFLNQQLLKKKNREHPKIFQNYTKVRLEVHTAVKTKINKLEDVAKL